MQVEDTSVYWRTYQESRAMQDHLRKGDQRIWWRNTLNHGLLKLDRDRHRMSNCALHRAVDRLYTLCEGVIMRQFADPIERQVELTDLKTSYDDALLALYDGSLCPENVGV